MYAGGINNQYGDVEVGRQGGASRPLRLIKNSYLLIKK
jgi:hypothetical protein